MSLPHLINRVLAGPLTREWGRTKSEYRLTDEQQADLKKALKFVKEIGNSHLKKVNLESVLGWCKEFDLPGDKLLHLYRNELLKCSRVIPYRDEYSIGKRALNDLYIGAEHCMLATNDSRCCNLPSGCTVVITAEENGTKYVQIGLIRYSSRSTLWLDNGGCHWKYAYKMQPLTPIFQFTKANQALLDKCWGIKPAQPFHYFACRHGRAYKKFAHLLAEEGQWITPLKN